MKRFAKIIAVLLLSLILVSPVSALRSAIYFEGSEDGFAIHPGSEWADTDLFDELKSVMPGDTVTEEIRVRNSAPEFDYVKIYLRAEMHDPITNPLSDEVAAAETVASVMDFLSKLNMKVYNNDSLIYNSSPDKLDGLTENVLLGQFANGEGATIKAELSIPLDLSSEYMHRTGEIDWIFTVEGYKNGEIVEPETSDEPRPLPDDIHGTPRTLDAIFSYIALFLACAVVLILAIIAIRRTITKMS